MKYASAILIVGIVFYLSYVLLAQESESPEVFIDSTSGFGETEGTGRDHQAAREQGQVLEDTVDAYPDAEQDIYSDQYFADDQDIFSRKLFQKRLGPLSEKEKVIWSFRLAAPNTFL